MFASQIGHEGKHVQDYETGTGEYSSDSQKLTELQKNDISERRALKYQLGLYRKLSGSSARNPDAYDKYVQERIKTPHRRPGVQ